MRSGSRGRRFGCMSAAGPSTAGRREIPNPKSQNPNPKGPEREARSGKRGAGSGKRGSGERGSGERGVRSEERKGGSATIETGGAFRVRPPIGIWDLGFGFWDLGFILAP